jgi:hypothetical protein
MRSFLVLVSVRRGFPSHSLEGIVDTLATSLQSAIAAANTGVVDSGICCGRFVLSVLARFASARRSRPKSDQFILQSATTVDPIRQIGAILLDFLFKIVDG